MEASNGVRSSYKEGKFGAIQQFVWCVRNSSQRPDVDDGGVHFSFTQSAFDHKQATPD